MNALTIESALQQCTDRIDHLVARHATESPQQLGLWVVMIGTQCIVYPMLDGVAILNSNPEVGGIDDRATRFTRARAAHNVALNTRNGKGERGQAVRVSVAYAQCIAELEKVREFLTEAQAAQAARNAAIINHETP